ncbi:putative metalloprotease CJM1_0395 family protein [Breoghania sp. L-A4]|uniref:putative metalloprotease CJM1_0395 family protein n=1 Tax=Breoghania sp. L-A4 TaxID=2304600 RepID=UPI000E35C1D0|nr:putative metalloprotease CJM1_0395 family protein [Breoghania sp. L-A4]AXS41933.1 hypothetical protein D1F64_20385 [Breoghania sp. L-A4]
MAVSIGPFSAAQAYQRASIGARDAAQPRGAPAAETDGRSAVGAVEELSAEEKKQVSDLRKRDAEVRAHENAHAAAGGGHAGSPSYEMQRGPDGKSYAVGGEVAIDTSAESTPEATARKMQVVIRAALAPADPSPQDQRVAAAARQTLIAAQAEARKVREAERGGEETQPPGDSAPAGDAQDAVRAPEPAGDSFAAADDSGRGQTEQARAAQFYAARGERPDVGGTGSSPGIFGGDRAETSAPVFAATGELVGFGDAPLSPAGRDPFTDRTEQADRRLTASRAYGGGASDDGAARVFQILSRL